MKPRVAIYYSVAFGRNDGCPLYYYNVLKHQLNLDVTHLDPQGDVSRFGKFDLHFWVDWGEDGLPVDHTWRIPDDGGKKIYVVSDFHLDEKKYRLEKAKQFDYVFLNQNWYVPIFKDAGIENALYLPHAAEPQAYPKFEIVKKYDLAFIGHVQEQHKGNGVDVSRVEALDYMFKAIPNFFYGTRMPQFQGKNMFEDAAKKFCQSKIVFNISIGNDVNMRLFETLSTGSFLLTNAIPELKELETLGLEAGEHFITYDSLKDAEEKAKYYIEHDEEREKIAADGHEAFMAGHTYKHRVLKVLETVGYKSL